MTKHVEKPNEPDLIARKLFFMTVFGAMAFGTVVMIMTHWVPEDASSNREKITGIVKLVPSH